MPKKETEKFAASALMEGMTSLSAVLKAMEMADGNRINDRRVEKVLYDAGKTQKLNHELHFLREKAKEHGFLLQPSDEETISSLTVGNSHGGVIAFCTERTFPEIRPEHIVRDGFYVYLEGMEDPYNFGYTLRSLYAAGVTGVLLSPRNWMSAAGVVARSSAGTSELLPIYLCQPDQLAQLFHEAHYQIIAAGIRDSVSLYETSLTLPLLMIIGGEKRGISRTLLDLSDRVVRIDYGRTFRGSLSAASAATVMAFEVMRQNRTLSSPFKEETQA